VVHRSGAPPLATAPLPSAASCSALRRCWTAPRGGSTPVPPPPWSSLAGATASRPPLTRAAHRWLGWCHGGRVRGPRAMSRHTGAPLPLGDLVQERRYGVIVLLVVHPAAAFFMKNHTAARVPFFLPHPVRTALGFQSFSLVAFFCNRC